jgi:hypothetical protein
MLKVERAPAAMVERPVMEARLVRAKMARAVILVRGVRMRARRGKHARFR